MLDHKPCRSARDVLNILERIYLLYRHVATEGSWATLEILKEYIDLSILSVPSDSTCYSWRIPKAWKVKHASVRHGDKSILLGTDHPLTVQPYSTSFHGTVSRGELLQHTIWSETRPDAYAYKSQLAYQTDIRQDWQISIPWSTVQNLPDGPFEVDLETEWTDGAMPVGEVFLPGAHEQTIVLMAHICHPGIADDGLSGVVTGIRLMQWLNTLPNRRYSYLLLMPIETIGSIAWLAHNEERHNSLAAGIVMESLGNRSPICWKKTYPGDTTLDHITRHAGKRIGKLEERDFRDKVGNDELVFADPDFAVPMVSLQRWPYPEYHTSDDTPACMTESSLDESYTFAQGIIDILENDYIPVRCFKGPLHLSRHGLYVDARENFDLYSRIWKIMQMMDGKTSVFEIAEAIDYDFHDLCSYLETWIAKGLLEKAPVQPEASFPSRPVSAH